MRIILDAKKSAQDNALAYFDAAKKLKLKIKGAEEGIATVQAKINELEKQRQKTEKKKPILRKLRDKEWFEKFRWGFTRNGLLMVGGRDAHSNEALVKKHLEEDDLYFHADIFGAPHCVLKKGKVSAKKEDKEDTASFAALFSSAWKKGLFSVRVYSVSKEQVSKKAPAGESLGRGAFMIYGTREWFEPGIRTALGVQQTSAGFRVCCGPFEAVKKFTQYTVEILPGSKSKSDIATSYIKFISSRAPEIHVSLDEVSASLPNGELAMALS